MEMIATAVVAAESSQVSQTLWLLEETWLLLLLLFESPLRSFLTWFDNLQQQCPYMSFAFTRRWSWVSWLRAGTKKNEAESKETEQCLQHVISTGTAPALMFAQPWMSNILQTKDSSVYAQKKRHIITTEILLSSAPIFSVFLKSLKERTKE